MFSYVGTLLGMQDIQVGHAEFDAEFVIQGQQRKAGAVALQQRPIASACKRPTKVSAERPRR